MGGRLLDWSTWRRLHVMRRVDAAAFLSTACAVLVVNAIVAVALGWSLYGLRAAYLRLAPRLGLAPRLASVKATAKATAAAEPK